MQYNAVSSVVQCVVQYRVVGMLGILLIVSDLMVRQAARNILARRHIHRKHCTVLVLGRDKGCTVKYSPLAEGSHKGEGLYLTVELSPSMDSISF